MLPFLISSAAVLVLCGACHFIGVAHAAGPVAVAQTAADASWQIVTDYGPLWGGLALAFGIAQSLLKRNESKHWIAQGRMLAVVTGGALVVGALLDWHFQHAPIAGVLVTIYAAFNLVWHPTTISGSNPSAQNSAVTMLFVVLALGGVALAPACASWRQRSGQGIGAALQCETPNVQSAIAQLLPMATAVIVGAISGDGQSVDRAILKAVAQPFKDTALQCALDAAVAAAADPPPRNPDAPASAPLVVNRDALLAAYRSVRAELQWADNPGLR